MSTNNKKNKTEQYTILSVVCSVIRIPESFSEFDGKELMSNGDRVIDKRTEEAIKGKDLFSRYVSWNFNGKVWWQDNKWLCEVWCYRSWRETFVCDSTEDILEEVSSEYGYD